MIPDNGHELAMVVEQIRTLSVQLRLHDQLIAVQLLEMAVLELKSRMHGIGDDEFDALVTDLAGRSADAHDPAKTADSALIGEQREDIARPAGPTRVVVSLGEARRAIRKCRN